MRGLPFEKSQTSHLSRSFPDQKNSSKLINYILFLNHKSESHRIFPMPHNIVTGNLIN